ncbi:PTS sugar transporter subunit IIA [Agromyces sp. MMS24-JH15]|uniref:PTS sugar transporter subunit IIA n=1 Tax=Agromyces sp. MMS24-JH15 TaxID=3243765 RepID=UPI0037489BE8
MSLPPLPDSAVVLSTEAADWRAAVRTAGRALVRAGAALPEYADRMIQVVDEYGAYIVIAPGLALAHARPGPDVTATGMSVVTLATPVAFGHPHNDPVRVVIGLAVTNAEDHIAGIASLANAFNDADLVDRLAAAATATEVRDLLGVTGGRAPTGADGAGR